MEKAIILLLFTVAIITFPVHSILAQDKQQTFVREYTYNAGETDSKVSSREKALEQVRTILLNEIGTYVESWVKSGITEKQDTVVNEFFKQEIKSVTAGVTETKIIKERWDGYEFYVKAKVTINTDDVLSKINNVLKARLNNQKIDTLRSLLNKEQKITSEKNEEISKLQNEIKNERSNRISAEEEVQDLNSKLNRLQSQLSKLNRKKIIIQSQVRSIEDKINTLTTDATEKIRTGMTDDEVIDLMGRQPRGSDDCLDRSAYNYGRIWILFMNGIVQHAIFNRQFAGSCRPISRYMKDYKNLLDK